MVTENNHAHRPARWIELLPSSWAWLIIVGYLSLMVLLAVLLDRYVDRQALRAIVEGAGVFGVIVFVIIEYIYVLLVPVYNTAIHLAAGYIFGGTLGWLLNFIATTAGLFTIILLVRRYGRPLLERVVSKSLLKKYDVFVDRAAPIALFIIYVLPFFPDDEITYVLAASKKVQFWRFLAPVVLGNISKTAVSYIGDEGTQGLSMAFGVRLIALIVGFVIISIQEWWIHHHQQGGF